MKLALDANLQHRIFIEHAVHRAKKLVEKFVVGDGCRRLRDLLTRPLFWRHVRSCTHIGQFGCCRVFAAHHSCARAFRHALAFFQTRKNGRLHQNKMKKRNNDILEQTSPSANGGISSSTAGSTAGLATPKRARYSLARC
jgi:hypothetical protein